MTGFVPNAGSELSGFPWLPLPEKVHFQEGPGILAKDFTDSGVPLVRLSGLGGYEVTLTGCNFVSVEKGSGKWGHFKLRKGEILVSTSASFGRPAVVGDEAEGAIFYTGLIRFSPKTGDVDAGYLKAFLGSELFMRQAEAMASGSVIRHFGPSHLREMRIPLPPLPDQRAIAATLGALDDKIELNRKMNATLEAMARALFRDWFVDFGPTRAKMEGRAPYLSPELWSLFPDRLDAEGKPEGWGVRPVYDFAHVIYGAPFASKQFNADNAGVPLIRIRDLATHDPGVWTEEVHPKGHLIEPGDIVVGMDGEFRLHVWKGETAWLNQRVCHFEPLPGVPLSFLAEALIEPLAFFERGKVGTTVIHLGKGDIDTFRLHHPGEKLLRAFGKIAEPLIAATVKNAAESRTLAQTRDLLLPRLMSGELRVANLVETELEIA